MGQGMPELVGFRVGQPQTFNVADFIEDDENVNEHSEIDLQATGKSLEQFGQVETLVVDILRKKVIGGNGRLRIMKEKQWKQFTGYPVEGTPEQIKTLAITLNKTGRLSDFNYSKLVVALQELQHSENEQLLTLTGFPQHELEPLLASEMNLTALEPEELPVPKKVKSEKDLDARGITIQFNVSQKTAVDEAITEYRGQAGDFSIAPAECLHRICKEYVQKELEE